jgi:hypothetical protein
MKNILKIVALLTLGASIVPVCRAEEIIVREDAPVPMIVDEIAVITPQDIVALEQTLEQYRSDLTDQERATFDTACIETKQKLANMTLEERTRFLVVSSKSNHIKLIQPINQRPLLRIQRQEFVGCLWHQRWQRLLVMVKKVA